jgi:hypothetical protein
MKRTMKTLRTIAHAGILAALFSSPLAVAEQATPEQTGDTSASRAPEIVPVSDVHWEPLNPARGDKSPRAATLWGDRKADVPTGFLVEFADGFSSPPHIHNVSYRGVVISGSVHNDDPDAAHLWMPAASFWTQPQGEVHITAAQGSRNLAYIEIDSGPYLVMPPEEAYDSGERPINVDASNLVWLDASEARPRDAASAPPNGDGAQVAWLWGSPRGTALRGALIKLPAGFTGTLSSDGSSFRGVVIAGRLDLQVSESDTRTLAPGSYWGTEGASTHPMTSAADAATILYVRTDGGVEVSRATPGD